MSIAKFDFKPLPPLTDKKAVLAGYEQHKVQDAEKAQQEFDAVAKDFAAMCGELFRTGPKLFGTDASAKLAHGNSLANLLDFEIAKWRGAAWATRQKLVQEFHGHVAEICATVGTAFISGDNAFFKSSDCPVKKYGSAPGSFVHVEKAVFIHVWGTPKGARRFLTAFQRLATAIVETRVHGATTPLTAMIAHAGTFITATTIPPVRKVLNFSMTRNPSSFLLYASLRRVHTALRLGAQQQTLNIGVLGDGRVCFFDVQGLLAEAAGGKPLMRYEHLQLQGGERSASDISAASVSSCGEAVIQEIAAKGDRFTPEEYVRSGHATRALHSRALQAKHLFHVYCALRATSKQQGPKAAAAEKGLLAFEIEMGLRAVRNLIWAQIADVEATELKKHAGGQLPDARMKLRACALNRVCALIANGTDGPSFWGEVILRICRSKFSAPDNFIVPYHKAADPVLNIIGHRFGMSWDGATARYGLPTPMPIGSSILTANDLFRVRWSSPIENQKNEVAVTLEMWRKTLESQPAGLHRENQWIRAGFLGGGLDQNNLLDFCNRGIKSADGTTENEAHAATLKVALAEIATATPKGIDSLSSVPADLLRDALKQVFTFAQLRRDIDTIMKHRLRKAVQQQQQQAGGGDDDGADLEQGPSSSGGGGKKRELKPDFKDGSFRKRNNLAPTENSASPAEKKKVLVANHFDSVFLHAELRYFFRILPMKDTHSKLFAASLAIASAAALVYHPIGRLTTADDAARLGAYLAFDTSHLAELLISAMQALSSVDCYVLEFETVVGGGATKNPVVEQLGIPALADYLKALMLQPAPQFLPFVVDHHAQVEVMGGLLRATADACSNLGGLMAPTLGRLLAMARFSASLHSEVRGEDDTRAKVALLHAIVLAGAHLPSSALATPAANQKQAEGTAVSSSDVDNSIRALATTGSKLASAGDATAAGIFSDAKFLKPLDALLRGLMNANEWGLAVPGVTTFFCNQGRFEDPCVKEFDLANASWRRLQGVFFVDRRAATNANDDAITPEMRTYHAEAMAYAAGLFTFQMWRGHNGIMLPATIEQEAIARCDLEAEEDALRTAAMNAMDAGEGEARLLRNEEQTRDAIEQEEDAAYFSIEEDLLLEGYVAERGQLSDEEEVEFSYVDHAAGLVVDGGDINDPLVVQGTFRSMFVCAAEAMELERRSAIVVEYVTKSAALLHDAESAMAREALEGVERAESEARAAIINDEWHPEGIELWANELVLALRFERGLLAEESAAWFRIMDTFHSGFYASALLGVEEAEATARDFDIVGPCESELCELFVDVADAQGLLLWAQHDLDTLRTLDAMHDDSLAALQAEEDVAYDAIMSECMAAGRDMFFAILGDAEASARARMDQQHEAWILRLYDEASDAFLNEALAPEEQRERDTLRAQMEAEASNLAVASAISAEELQRSSITAEFYADFFLEAFTLEGDLRALFIAEELAQRTNILIEAENARRAFISVAQSAGFSAIAGAAFAQLFEERVERLIKAEKSDRSKVLLAEVAASREVLDDGEAMLRTALAEDEEAGYERLLFIGSDMINAGQRMKIEQDHMDSFKNGLWAKNCTGRLELAEEMEGHGRWAVLFAEEGTIRTQLLIVDFEVALRGAIESRERVVFERAFADFGDDLATIRRDFIQSQEKRGRRSIDKESSSAFAALTEHHESAMREDFEIKEDAAFAAIVTRSVVEGGSKLRRSMERQELLKRDDNVKQPWVTATLALWVEWEEQTRAVMMREFADIGVGIIVDGEANYRAALQRYESERWLYLMSRHHERLGSAVESVFFDMHVAGRKEIWAQLYQELACLVEQQEADQRSEIALLGFIGMGDIAEHHDEQIFSALVADCVSTEAARRSIIATSWASMYVALIAEPCEAAARAVAIANEKSTRLDRCFTFEDEQRALVHRDEDRHRTRIMDLFVGGVALEKESTLIADEKKARASIALAAKTEIGDVIQEEEQDAGDRLFRYEMLHRIALEEQFSAEGNHLMIETTQRAERKERRALIISQANESLGAFLEFTESLRAIVEADYVDFALGACQYGEASRRAALEADERRGWAVAGKTFRKFAFGDGLDTIQANETAARWADLTNAGLYTFGIDTLVVEHEEGLRQAFEIAEDLERANIEERIFLLQTHAFAAQLEREELSERQRVVDKASHATRHAFLSWSLEHRVDLMRQEQDSRRAVVEAALLHNLEVAVLAAERLAREDLLSVMARRAGPLACQMLEESEFASRRGIDTSRRNAAMLLTEDAADSLRDAIESEERRARRANFGELQRRGIFTGMLSCIEDEERRVRGHDVVVARRVGLAQLAETEEAELRQLTIEADNVGERLYFTDALADDLRSCIEDDERSARRILRRDFSRVSTSSLLGHVEASEVTDRDKLWREFAAPYTIEIRLLETWGQRDGNNFKSSLHVGDHFRWEMESYSRAVRSEERRCFMELRGAFARLTFDSTMEATVTGEEQNRLFIEMDYQEAMLGILDATQDDRRAMLVEDDIDLGRRAAFADGVFGFIEHAIWIPEARERGRLLAKGGAPFLRYRLGVVEDEYHRRRAVIVDECFFGLYNEKALQDVSEPFERQQIEATWEQQTARMAQQLHSLASAANRHQLQRAELKARARLKRDAAVTRACFIEDCSEPIARSSLILAEFIAPLLRRTVRFEEKIRDDLLLDERLAADRLFYDAFDVQREAKALRLEHEELDERNKLFSARMTTAAMRLMESGAELGARAAISDEEGRIRSSLFRREIRPTLHRLQRAHVESAERDARFAIRDQHIDLKSQIYVDREETQRIGEIVDIEWAMRCHLTFTGFFEPKLRATIEREGLAQEGAALLTEEHRCRFEILRREIELGEEAEARAAVVLSRLIALSVLTDTFESAERAQLQASETDAFKAILQRFAAESADLGLQLHELRETAARRALIDRRLTETMGAFEFMDIDFRKVADTAWFAGASDLLQHAAEARIRTAMVKWEHGLFTRTAAEARREREKLQRLDVESTEAADRLAIKQTRVQAMTHFVDRRYEETREMTLADARDEREGIWCLHVLERVDILRRELQQTEGSARRDLWTSQCETRLDEITEAHELHLRVAHVEWHEAEDRGQLLWQLWIDRLHPALQREEEASWALVLATAAEEVFANMALDLADDEAVARDLIGTVRCVEEYAEILEQMEFDIREDGLWRSERRAFTDLLRDQQREYAALAFGQLEYDQRDARAALLEQRRSEVAGLYSGERHDELIAGSVIEPEQRARIALLFDDMHLMQRLPSAPASPTTTTTMTSPSRIRPSRPLEVLVRSSIETWHQKGFDALTAECLREACFVMDRVIRRSEREAREAVRSQWLADTLSEVLADAEGLARGLVNHKEAAAFRKLLDLAAASALRVAVIQLEFNAAAERKDVIATQRDDRLVAFDEYATAWHHCHRLDETRARRAILLQVEARGRAALASQWFSRIVIAAPPFYEDLFKLQLASLEAQERKARTLRLQQPEAIARARALDEVRHAVFYAPMRKAEHEAYVRITQREEETRFVLLRAVIAEGEVAGRRRVVDGAFDAFSAELQHTETAVRWATAAPLWKEILPPAIERHENNVRSTARREFEASRNALLAEFASTRFTAGTFDLEMSERHARRQLLNSEHRVALQRWQDHEATLRSLIADSEDATVDAIARNALGAIAGTGLDAVPVEHAFGAQRLEKQATRGHLGLLEDVESDARRIRVAALDVFPELAPTELVLTLRNRYVLWLQDLEHAVRMALGRYQTDRREVLLEAAASDRNGIERTDILTVERGQRQRVLRLGIFGVRSYPPLFSLDADTEQAVFWTGLCEAECEAARGDTAREEATERAKLLAPNADKLRSEFVHLEQGRQRRAIFVRRTSEMLSALEDFEANLRAAAIQNFQRDVRVRFERAFADATLTHMQTRHDLGMRALYSQHHRESWAALLRELEIEEGLARAIVIDGRHLASQDVLAEAAVDHREVTEAALDAELADVLHTELKERIVALKSTALRDEATARQQAVVQQIKARKDLFEEYIDESYVVALRLPFAQDRVRMHERLSVEAVTMQHASHLAERERLGAIFRRDRLILARDETESGEARGRRNTHLSRLATLVDLFSGQHEPLRRRTVVATESTARARLQQHSTALHAKHFARVLQETETSTRRAIVTAHAADLLEMYSGAYLESSIASSVEAERRTFLRDKVIGQAERVARSAIVADEKRAAARLFEVADSAQGSLATDEFEQLERAERGRVSWWAWTALVAGLDDFADVVFDQIDDEEETERTALRRAFTRSELVANVGGVETEEAEERCQLRESRIDGWLTYYERHEAGLREALELRYHRERLVMFSTSALAVVNRTMAAEKAAFGLAKDLFDRDVSFTARIDVAADERRARVAVRSQWARFWLTEIEERERGARYDLLRAAEKGIVERVVKPMARRRVGVETATIENDEFVQRRQIRGERAGSLAVLVDEAASSFVESLWADQCAWAALFITADGVGVTASRPGTGVMTGLADRHQRRRRFSAAAGDRQYAFTGPGLEASARGSIVKDEAAARQGLHDHLWNLRHVQQPLFDLVAEEEGKRIKMRRQHLDALGATALKVFEEIHRDIVFEERIAAEFDLYKPNATVIAALARASVETDEAAGRQKIRGKRHALVLRTSQELEAANRAALRMAEYDERKQIVLKLEVRSRSRLVESESAVFASFRSSFRDRRRQLIVDLVETQEQRRRHQLKLQARFGAMNLTESAERHIRRLRVTESQGTFREVLCDLEAGIRSAYIAERAKWLQRQRVACYQTAWDQELQTESSRRTIMTSNAFIHRYLIMRSALIQQSLVEFKHKFVEQFAIAERGVMYSIYCEGRLNRTEWAERRTRRALEDSFISVRRRDQLAAFALDSHALAGQHLLRSSLKLGPNGSGEGCSHLLQHHESLERHRIGVMQYLQEASDILVKLALASKTSSFRGATEISWNVHVPQWQLWQKYVAGVQAITHDAIDIFKTRSAEMKVALLFLDPSPTKASGPKKTAAAAAAGANWISKARAGGGGGNPPVGKTDSIHRRVVKTGLGASPSGKMAALTAEGSADEPGFAGVVSKALGAAGKRGVARRGASKPRHAPGDDVLAKEASAALWFEVRCKRQDVATTRQDEMRNLQEVMFQEEWRLHVFGKGGDPDDPFDAALQDVKPRWKPDYDEVLSEDGLLTPHRGQGGAMSAINSARSQLTRTDSATSFESLNAMPVRGNMTPPAKPYRGGRDAKSLSPTNNNNNGQDGEPFDPDSTQGHRSIQLANVRRQLQEQDDEGVRRHRSGGGSQSLSPIPRMKEDEDGYDPAVKKANSGGGGHPADFSSPAKSAMKSSSRHFSERRQARVVDGAAAAAGGGGGGRQPPMSDTPPPKRSVQDVLGAIGKRRSQSVEPPTVSKPPRPAGGGGGGEDDGYDGDAAAASGSFASASRAARRSGAGGGEPTALSKAQLLAQKGALHRDESNKRDALLHGHAIGVSAVGMLANHMSTMAAFLAATTARFERNLFTFRRREALIQLSAEERRARLGLVQACAASHREAVSKRERGQRRRIASRAQSSLGVINRDRLHAGTAFGVLKAGQSITSTNAMHRLLVEASGELLVQTRPKPPSAPTNGAAPDDDALDIDWETRWSSDELAATSAPPEKGDSGVNESTTLVLQSDGNLAVYVDGEVVWTSHTMDSGACVLVMKNNGDLALCDRGMGQVWNSGSQLVAAPERVAVPAALPAKFTDSDTDHDNADCDDDDVGAASAKNSEKAPDRDDDAAAADLSESGHGDDKSSSSSSTWSSSAASEASA